MRVMIEKVGVSIGEAAMMASTNPANLLRAHDRGRLEIAARADLIVLNQALDLKAVFIGGRELA
jgi:N-acetylglucosamine-6-phosphate deacetylase